MEGLTKGFHLFFEYGEFDSPDAPGDRKSVV